MSGLLLRSHMNAGQDGFRNSGPKHETSNSCQWDHRGIVALIRPYWHLIFTLHFRPKQLRSGNRPRNYGARYSASRQRAETLRP